MKISGNQQFRQTYREALLLLVHLVAAGYLY